MPRARIIKPGFFKNETLGSLPPLARLLFEGLWCLADREGRLEDRPAKIKAEILPYENLTPEEFDGLLSLLASPPGSYDGQGFILRYEVVGRRYIAVTHFRAHQNPHPDERASVIPPPEEPRGAADPKGGNSPAVLDESVPFQLVKEEGPYGGHEEAAGKNGDCVGSRAEPAATNERAAKSPGLIPDPGSLIHEKKEPDPPPAPSGGHALMVQFPGHPFLQTLPAASELIFRFWKWYLEHPQAKLTSDRQRKIHARLKEGYTGVNIIRGIMGIQRIAFNMGQNEGGQILDDITLILQTGSKLERFQQKATEEEAAAAFLAFLEGNKVPLWKIRELPDDSPPDPRWTFARLSRELEDSIRIRDSGKLAEPRFEDARRALDERIERLKAEIEEIGPAAREAAEAAREEAQ